MNELTLKTLIDGYDQTAYTHLYMFGFADRGSIYMCVADSTLLPYICTLDKASRGYGYSLRFKPTKAQKELLKLQHTEVICTEEYFNMECANSKYNRGEIFEKLVTEHFGQVWTKDNVPYTDAGDIEVNGVAYQIKYQKATFCTEKSLQNAKERA